MNIDVGVRCWMNMGEAQLHQFKITEGIYSYTKTVELGDMTAPARLLRAKVCEVHLHYVSV